MLQQTRGIFRITNADIQCVRMAYLNERAYLNNEALKKLKFLPPYPCFFPFFTIFVPLFFNEIIIIKNAQYESNK